MPQEGKKERPVHFLDLDALAPDPHEFEYKGEVYRLKILTTRDFLELQRTVDVLKGAEGDELSVEAVEAALEFIKPVIPGFPEEELDNMSTVQLTALAQFCAEVISGPSLEEAKKVRGMRKAGS